METPTTNNVIPFPRVHRPPSAPPTPKFDKIAVRAGKLAKLSNYPCTFDFDIYKRLETRFAARPPRGGVVFQSPFKLVNSHNTCQQCLYAFEVDTYGRGCIHNCVYCYAKAEVLPAIKNHRCIVCKSCRVACTSFRRLFS